MATTPDGGGGGASPQPKIGWYKSGQMLPKSQQDPTGGAYTGFKHGRVNRSKRKRK